VTDRRQAQKKTVQNYIRLRNDKSRLTIVEVRLTNKVALFYLWHGACVCVLGAVNDQQQIVSVGNTVRLTCDGLRKYCVTIRYNRWFALENWQASCQFNL